jgi:Raf kinase inhibitor-like YbhB/YbcL family protein
MRSTVLALLLLAQPAFAAGKLSVKSSDLKPGGTLPGRSVFNSFGCTGGNVSPQLSWSNAPAGTKSFAVTVYDPDAPTGSGWWHWVVYDIPAGVNELPQGAGGGTGLPAGAVQGKTDFGTANYGGACPPPGKPHRYVFTVHALKVEKLGVPADATAAMVGFNLHASELGKASLTVTYGRKK